MTAYTAPRELPVEALQPGDEVRVHHDDTGDLWAVVVHVLGCDDTTCPVGGLCGGIVAYPATSVHYDCTATLTVRIPCEPEPALVCGCGSAPDGAPGTSGCSPSCMTPEPATTPAGPTEPADADPVWVTAGRAGIPMHRLDTPSAAITACGRNTGSGRVTTAANAIVSWDADPCRRCWPVAA